MMIHRQIYKSTAQRMIGVGRGSTPHIVVGSTTSPQHNTNTASPQVIAQRSITYEQRKKLRGEGSWKHWYADFVETKRYYENDPTHIRWFPPELKQEAHITEAKTYRKIFEYSDEDMDFAKACREVDSLRLDHGIKPGSWAYAGTLLHLAKLKDIPFMTHFWRKLKSSLPSDTRLGPNAFHAMAHSLARNHDVEGAQYVLEELQASGHALNANSYNALCSFDRPSLMFMEAIMETLESKRIAPNADTFTLLMDALSRELQFDRVAEVFNSITDVGGTPHLPAYEALMRSRCVAQQPSEARDVLEYLQEEKPYGIVPRVTTYNLMLSYYDSHGMSADAVELFRVMKERGVFPNTETYNALIRAHYNYGEPLKAIELFDSHSIQRNQGTYAAVIDACVQAGKYERAVELLALCRKRGFVYNERNDPPTYFEPLTAVYPRRCDYWEDCGDHNMTWDRAIQFSHKA